MSDEMKTGCSKHGSRLTASEGSPEARLELGATLTGIEVNKDLAQAEMGRLEALVAEVVSIQAEEAVPKEMLDLFADEQWPELMIEFQPSLELVTFELNTVEQHQHRYLGKDRLPVEASGSTWVMVNGETELTFRKTGELEQAMMMLFRRGSDIDEVGTQLDLAESFLKQVIENWCDEGLVIDIGVPIPEDASYEASDPTG